MIIFPDGRGGVLVGASSESTRDYSDVCYLFWERAVGGEGGGVWPLPGGSCGCVAGRAPNTKRLIVITFHVTMSDSISEELTDLMVASFARIGTSGSKGALGFTRTSG